MKPVMLQVFMLVEINIVFTVDTVQSGSFYRHAKNDGLNLSPKRR
jgi:hypothetical protein